MPTMLFGTYTVLYTWHWDLSTIFFSIVGDVTCIATIPFDMEVEAYFLAKEDGIIAGIALADMIFHEVDTSLKVWKHWEDVLPLYVHLVLGWIIAVLLSNIRWSGLKMMEILSTRGYNLEKFEVRHYLENIITKANEIKYIISL